MTVRTATQFCELVENRLGFDPFRIAKAQGKTVWKVKAMHAGIVNKKIATNPLLFTWENLELAVAYLYRKRMEVASPTAVFWFVEKALETAIVPDIVDDVGDLVEAAVEQEMAWDLPDSLDWVGRLARASGEGRQEVLDQWRTHRLSAASLT